MTAKAQATKQAKTPATPAPAHIIQPPVGVPEREAGRPDIAAQLEGAARLGHSLGAVKVHGSAPPIIQRQEIPEDEEEELQLKREPAAVQRQETPEEEEEELMLKRDSPQVGPQGGQVPPDVEAAIRRARGGGQPLEGALQEQMSASLGHDFSGVRVHTDAEADQLNQQLQAKAFTTGPDIFFKRAAYAPATSSGRELIAHELTHVVQQAVARVGGDGRGMTVRPAGEAFELEAERFSRVAATGGVRGGQRPLGDKPGVATLSGADTKPVIQAKEGDASNLCEAEWAKVEEGQEIAYTALSAGCLAVTVAFAGGGGAGVHMALDKPNAQQWAEFRAAVSGETIATVYLDGDMWYGQDDGWHYNVDTTEYLPLTKFGPRSARELIVEYGPDFAEKGWVNGQSKAKEWFKAALGAAEVIGSTNTTVVHQMVGR